MKASLTCYLALLAVVGFVTFHATGSPMLLAVPLSGLLMYAAMSMRSGAWAEGTAIFFSGLCLTLTLMQFQGVFSAVFLGLLSVTHFFAATQAVWEIIHGGKDKSRSLPQLRLTVFTIAFYSSLAEAWVIMRGDDLKLLLAHRQVFAGIVVLLAVCGWEFSRMVRLRRAENRIRLSLIELWRRLLAGLGLALALLALFVIALPAFSEWLSGFSPKLATPKLETPKIGPPRRLKDATAPPPAPQGTPRPQTATTGPDRTAGGEGEAKLPSRATLQLPKTPRLFLQFSHKEDASRLLANGRLYVRSLALGRHDGEKWLPASENGTWSQDADDGRKDGRVTLSEPGPASVAHTIFLAAADGGALPALPGVQEYSLAKVFSLPDDWHQAELSGDVRYDARSTPKFFDQLPADDLRAGKLTGYTAVPDGNMHDVVESQGSQIFQGKRGVADAVAALRTHFAQHFTYSEVVENPKDLPPLENFLTEERKGYCDFFSTASAMLLRRLDVPTRVAFGYAGGQYDEKSGAYVFLGTHAHSWTEIYLEKHGWVICEFTPPGGLPNTDDAASSAGGWNLAEFKSAAAAEKKKKKKEPEPSLLDQIQGLAPVYGPILGAVMLAGSVVTVIVWAWMRRRKEQNSPEAKARRAAAQREKQPEFFLEFVKMCEEFGYARAPGDTLLELQSVLKRDQFFHPKFDALARYYYQTRYEDVRTDEAAEDSWIRLIRDFRRERREMRSREAKSSSARP